MDLSCVVYPAKYVDGNILIKLHVASHDVKELGSATQHGNSCTANNNMTECGQGTQSTTSDVKIYKLHIKRMKMEYYTKWTCSQSVFSIQSSDLDLRTYSK